MYIGHALMIQLMAGTMLFLASKIEEEPLKLRYICNACLSKFDNDVDGVLAWKPAGDDGVRLSA